MGKSYKDTIKQPKKNSPSKAIRAQYEEEEAETAMRNYVGTSFQMSFKPKEGEE